MTGAANDRVAGRQDVGAADLLSQLARAGQTVATAESLTGGLLAAALTDVAGASTVFRGGVVAYHSDLKVRLAGVEAGLLEAHGPVSAPVAQAMAEGVRAVTAATWGLGTTGVAGPDEVDGHPVGTVYVAVAGPLGSQVRRLSLQGDRAAIRRDSVDHCLRLLAEAVRSAPR